MECGRSHTVRKSGRDGRLDPQVQSRQQDRRHRQAARGSEMDVLLAGMTRFDQEHSSFEKLLSNRPGFIPFYLVKLRDKPSNWGSQPNDCFRFKILQRAERWHPLSISSTVPNSTKRIGMHPTDLEALQSANAMLQCWRPFCSQLGFGRWELLNSTTGSAFAAAKAH